jgi:hypothetical protein
MWLGDQCQIFGRFTPGKDPVPVVHKAEWNPRGVWTGAENFAPPRFDLQAFRPVASRYTDWAILRSNDPAVYCAQFLFPTIRMCYNSPCLTMEWQQSNSRYPLMFCVLCFPEHNVSAIGSVAIIGYKESQVSYSFTPVSKTCFLIYGSA